MFRDILSTAFIILTTLATVMILASIIVEYATRPQRKEDNRNSIKFRSVKAYKRKKKAHKKAG